MTKTLRRVLSRLAGFLAGRRREPELAEEFESHLEMLAEENVRKGMTPELARRAALLRFGGVESAKENYRDQFGLPWLENLLRDIRYAFRGMRRSPGFTAVAIGCLALGIGANTTVFSVANAVLIRSLPVREPGRLALFSYEFSGDIRAVRRTQVGDDRTTFPYAAYEALREHTQTLTGVAAFVPVGMNQQSLTVNTGGQAIVAGGEMVSGNYFQVLGVAPVLGRPIIEDDARPGAPNVTVISHQFWQRELGGEPSAIGRSVAVNNLPFTVVGVMPREFFGLNPALPPDLWIALRDQRGLKPWGRMRPGPGGLSPFADKGYWWCLMIGRLKPGVSSAQAQAEADIAFRESITEGLSPRPAAGGLPRLALLPAARGLDNLRRSLAEPLHILMGAVSLVLLIACANVATLLLARASARQKEIGVRLELGASRARLVRQLLTESVLLSLCGGAAGLGVAAWGSEPLLALLSTAGQPIRLDARPDMTVLAFSVAVSLMTGALFGLAPALRATRRARLPQFDPSAGRGSPRLTLSRVLVAGQAAVSVLLVFGAGLFIRTLRNLENQDLGFNRDNLLLFEIDPRRAGATPERTAAVFDEALDKLRMAPGVRSASLSATPLLAGYTDGGAVATDGSQAAPTNEVYFNVVGPEFLETMGIRLLSGRGIDWRDIRARERVAVVNDALVRRLFPGRNPLGAHFSFEVPYDARAAFEIVGVVRNAKYDGMRADPPPTAYLPYGALRQRLARMCFEVRTTGDPRSAVAGVRDTIRSIDPALPLIDIRTQREQIGRALEHERMFARMSTLFGVLALALISVGIYGTLAYAATRRTCEIGIRMALGATRLSVLWMVLRESLLLAGCGLALGLPAALLMAELVASRLFGVDPQDGLTAVVTAVVLAATAATAGFLPANRASRIDPIRAIRYE